MNIKSPVIIALDFDNLYAIEELVEKLDPKTCRLKIGKQAFTLFGPELVKSLVAKGFDVFLDLKFHDIPNTTAKACEAAADLGVWMVNVHASGGEKMMLAAREALQMPNAPLLIAVTVLTSMDDISLNQVGVNSACEEQVLKLASLTKNSGLDGVVCSSQEATVLRKHCGKDFLLVTPGIRMAEDNADDQNRIMTPVKAMQNGSSYLVIGRPITKSDDPVGKLLTINTDLGCI